MLGKRLDYDLLFGSIVSDQYDQPDAQAIYNYLKTVKPDLPPNFTKYTDDYELREAGEPTNDEDGELYFTDQYAIVPKIQPYHAELVAVVIAKRWPWNASKNKWKRSWIKWKA